MISAAIRIPRTTVVQATNKHTATLFFFHGSGSNGEDVKQWIDILNRTELRFPHIKIVYPSAPIQPYTPNGGMPSCVWFDRNDISIKVPEVKESVDLICEKASELIDKETTKGIPYNRIIIGGFSMGGSLSMMLAYKFRKSIAGCCVMSSFLNRGSSVYESLKTSEDEDLPELLQFHGASDMLVPLDWGKETHDKLKQLGVKGDFHTLDQTEHELSKIELEEFKEWILKLLPNK